MFQRGGLRHIFLLETKSDDYRSRRRRDTSLPYRSRDEMIHDITNQIFHEKNVVFAEVNRQNLSRKVRGIYNPDSRRPRGGSRHTRGVFNPDECCDFNDPEYNKQWYYVSRFFLSGHKSNLSY